jgi:hypothetical protein
MVGTPPVEVSYETSMPGDDVDEVIAVTGADSTLAPPPPQALSRSATQVSATPLCRASNSLDTLPPLFF